MDYGFTGRTVIVTGASRGQGAAEAEILVREGARVIGADVLDEEGQARAGRLTAAGPGSMDYWHLDVSSEEQWAGLAAHLAGRPVHGLVNNAGVPYRARLLDMDLAGWDRVIAINLRGVWLGMKYTLPHMIKNGGGSVINTASVAGIVGLRGSSAYCAAKAGGIDLTRVAALESNQVSRLLPVPDQVRLVSDLRRVDRMLAAEAPVAPADALVVGRPVRITAGPASWSVRRRRCGNGRRSPSPSRPCGRCTARR